MKLDASKLLSTIDLFLTWARPAFNYVDSLQMSDFNRASMLETLSHVMFVNILNNKLSLLFIIVYKVFKK